MAELRAGGSPVQVTGVRVSSDAVDAEVVPATAAVRDSTAGPLLGALAELGLRAEAVVGLDAARPATSPQPQSSAGRRRGLAARSGAGGVPTDVVVEVAAPPPGQAQVLLVDDGGAVSWVMPESAPGPGTRSRASQVTRFRVPIAPQQPDGDVPGQRGIIGKAVRRVVHVLTFDLIDKVAGEVGDYFVSRWEAKQRPHRIRSFTDADYCDPAAPSLDATTLATLGDGQALLLIHGTNSLSHSGFGALPPDAVAAMNARYGGRVFAFDHPTLSVDPTENGKALAGLLGDGPTLDVDILAHSRGGLVARVLAELASAAGTADRLRVRQVVFVATPNLGTPLADPEHFGKLLDGLTNLLDLIPDNPITDSLAGIVAVVRQLAVGAAKGLDGLMAQNRRLSDNPFLTNLNSARPHTTRYRAIVADYEPPPDTPRGRWFRDAAIDAIFEFEPNDLIVPTASTYSWNGADSFPIAERIVLPTDRAVDHSTFWTAPEPLNAFATWLSADPAALAPQPAIGPVSLARAAEEPLSEVDERFAAGDMDGVRQAVRALPESELRRLESEVGDLALDEFLSRGLREPKAGVVFVLPGIMGTNLWAKDGRDKDRIWLNPLRLLKGDFSRLRVVDGPGTVEAGGLYRGYLPLVVAMDSRWEVIPAGYDWRLPLEAAAESLAAQISERSGGIAMPAHLVCHSMGGLVARMLVARHPDVWASIDSPADRNRGGRMIQLGTPNLGSFAITLALTGDDHLVQWLARLDAPHDLRDIVRVIGTFAGAYQLLTSPDITIDGSAHAELYDAATWKSDAILAEHLAGARRAHEELARSGFDAVRMFYVAGSGHATPAALRIDDADTGRFSYRMTDAGDGRVTHELGLPLDAAGEPVFGTDRVWYSSAEHGDLTKDRETVAAVADILQSGGTARLRDTPPAPARGAVVAEERWIPAELVEPPVDDATPIATPGARGRRSQAGSRAQLRAEAQAASDRAVRGWLGASPEAETLPVLHVGVLHASLEYSAYAVMVGHYQGGMIAGAEGYLDKRLGGQLTGRQVAGRYPDELGQVLRVPTDGRPPGALVVGLGPMGDLTPTSLASAVRDAALEHAFGWLDDPCRVGDGNIGLSTCLLGSYGPAGLTLGTSVVAIAEGVALANVVLASAVPGKVRITALELVERYAGAAEEAAHVIRALEGELPGALLEAMTIQPDLCLRQGEGRRPAVRTADYGAGQWHRIVVKSSRRDRDGRTELRFTSFGSRARADELTQEVDTVLLRRMLETAVTRPTVDGRVNTAMFEMLFPTDLKRELAGVDNIQLVVDDDTADFPWEALTDRGGLTGSGPVALRGGFLRQLATTHRRQLEPLSGMPRALVVGDPPGDPQFFARLDGARREAQEVADLLTRVGSLGVESLIFPADTGPDVDSASQVVAALMGDDFQILHIAGHGHFEPRGANKPLGGVVIGPGAYLTAATLRSLRRPPDVVFLNCCHLGSVGATTVDDPAADSHAFTRKRLNELAASLSRELTQMGVRAVIVAGWAVSDRPAAEFARAFYSRMLDGEPFGDAVHAARSVAFGADNGASNTWAAYQCYGDPSFRLKGAGARSTHLAPPVSADEMQRRLEEIEVAARDANRTYKLVLSRQVEQQYELAEREWPTKSRMWTAFGWAHATLGERAAAIKAYRRALDRQDGMAPLKAVEELADNEHALSIELTRDGMQRAAGLDGPATPRQLRDSAKRRLDSLDRLGRSSSRHALRARCHERTAALAAETGDAEGRTGELSAAAEEYAEAWRLSGEGTRRDPTLAVRALQVVALGGRPPADEPELRRYVETWMATKADGDFAARAGVADLALADKLQDIDQDGVRADVVATYERAFAAGSAPDERTNVVDRIAVLATLADDGGRAGLTLVGEELAVWNVCRR